MPRSTTRIDRQELGHAVTEAVREMILSGEVAPGERLVETDLAERFGTSRGPVRDALAALETSGLVVIRPRRGSFVAELTVDDVDELYTLRLALETLAIRTAAAAGRSVDTARMRSALDRIATSDDPVVVGGADMDLHRAIVEASGHDRLGDAWEQLADQTLLTMRHLSFSRPDIQGEGGEHAAIIQALEDGDTERAVEALHAHLRDAQQTVRQRF